MRGVSNVCQTKQREGGGGVGLRGEMGTECTRPRCEEGSKILELIAVNVGKGPQRMPMYGPGGRHISI